LPVTDNPIKTVQVEPVRLRDGRFWLGGLKEWFGNVELMVAKDIGQETLPYVSNIYKYYVAYKTAIRTAKDPRTSQASGESKVVIDPF
jgi:hypothetical protein